MGLGTHSVCVFFPVFLACALLVGSTVGVQNIGRGRYAVPEIVAKKGSVAQPILRQDVGRRPADTAAQLLTISGVSYFTRRTYASLASVWSVSGLYVHA